MAIQNGSSVSHVLPYSPTDCFLALKRTAYRLSSTSMYNYKTESIDETLQRITLKAGMSWRSFGENIAITVSPAPDGFSSVSIISTTRTGALVDLGKNNKNINEIMEVFSEQLKTCKKVSPQSNQKVEARRYMNNSQTTRSTSSGDDAISKLERLAKLRDSGVLTEEEFEQQKAKILNA